MTGWQKETRSSWSSQSTSTGIFCEKKLRNRLLITGIMLGAKFFDDYFYNNEYYAKIGGISNVEMNLLEIEFLNLINFSLYVDPILFFRYRQQLLKQANAWSTGKSINSVLQLYLAFLSTKLPYLMSIDVYLLQSKSLFSVVWSNSPQIIS